MDSTTLLNQLRSQMEKAVKHTLEEFSRIHTGKASPTMIEHVLVEAYGSKVPLKEVATISTPEPRVLSVQPWDKSLLAATESALRQAHLNFNPITSNTTILCPLAELSGERREDLAKICAKLAEQGRVGVRNARQNANQSLKQLEKDKVFSQDESKLVEKSIQAMTNEFIEKIEQQLKYKEKELLQC